MDAPENMSSGRGWVAGVAVMVGGACFAEAVAVAALFPLGKSLGFRFQGKGRGEMA